MNLVIHPVARIKQSARRRTENNSKLKSLRLLSLIFGKDLSMPSNARPLSFVHWLRPKGGCAATSAGNADCWSELASRKASASRKRQPIQMAGGGVAGRKRSQRRGRLQMLHRKQPSGRLPRLEAASRRRLTNKIGMYPPDPLATRSAFSAGGRENSSCHARTNLQRKRAYKSFARKRQDKRAR